MDKDKMMARMLEIRNALVPFTLALHDYIDDPEQEDFVDLALSFTERSVDDLEKMYKLLYPEKS